ncbi:MAG: DNA replication/repair protein RecF [Bacteroidota bacterium]|nr:DNA replication/repair protein RecF [Bacteroidota bacterium]
MYLIKLRLINFRNHSDSLFEFNNRANILFGDNGHGKTNVIEGISFLCLTKSFYASNDLNSLSFNRTLFEIEGKFVTDHEREVSVRVAYSGEQREKCFLINKQPTQPLSSIIGKFPVVICSPEHLPITNGGPQERRKFIDIILSQSNSIYLQRLLEYRHILKQRNKILFNGKISGGMDQQILEPWTEQLVNQGSYLIHQRKQFVDVFNSQLQTAYCNMVGGLETPTIEYVPVVEDGDISSEKNIRERFHEKLREENEDEKRLGTTLVGPHRDELMLKINGMDIRKYASQGQHKTFLVALKLGEFFYLKERCIETPILLLDDIFSELDNTRSEQLLKFVGTLSQTFITTTSSYMISHGAFEGCGNKIFYINNGTILKQESR